MLAKGAKSYFLILSVLVLIFSITVDSYAQKPSNKPPINKKQSKAAGIKQLFKGSKQNKRKKKRGTQESSQFSGENISKSGPANKSKRGKPLGSNKLLNSEVSNNKGVQQSKKSFNYSGTNKGKAKKGVNLSNLKIGNGARKIGFSFISPQKRKRRQLSSRSLSFSGENISKPSQGQLAKKDRKMNRKAKKGMYVNHTKLKKLRSNLSYTSLNFTGRNISSSYKGKSERARSSNLGKKKKSGIKGASTRVKVRTRPVANKLAGKKRQRLSRMSKKKKARLKYDKKEREIWTR